MSKRLVTLCSVVSLLGGVGAAAAQPFDQPPPDDGGDPPVDTWQPPEEPPPPQPPPPPAREPAPAPAPTPAPTPAADPSGTRPPAYAVGIGLGYRLPADLQAPNTTSVRFRLASGLTLEPLVTAGRTSSTSDDGVMEETDTISELDLALFARFPLRSRGRVDFVLVGALGFGVTTTNPEGPDNDTRTQGFGAAWGIGLDYWFGPHWQLSFTATNPLLSMVKSTREIATVPPMEVTDSTTTFGVVFDPDVMLMLHLYY
jgi:hypothetical protein